MDYLLHIAKVQNAQSLKCCERLRPTDRKFGPTLAVFLLQNFKLQTQSYLSVLNAVESSTVALSVTYS